MEWKTLVRRESKEGSCKQPQQQHYIAAVWSSLAMTWRCRFRCKAIKRGKIFRQKVAVVLGTRVDQQHLLLQPLALVVSQSVSQQQCHCCWPQGSTCFRDYVF